MDWKKSWHDYVWTTVPLERMGRGRRMLVKTLRLFALAGGRFVKNKCGLQAASLTFFSLMALIPVLALMLTMAKSFGGANLAREKINKQLDSWLVQMETSANTKAAQEQALANPGETAEEKAAAAKRQAEATSAFSAQMRTTVNGILDQLDAIGFGTLGGIGAIMLLWTVIGTLSKVEQSFNEVWNVGKCRSIVRKMSDYLFTIIVLPFLCLAASTVPIANMAKKAIGCDVGALMGNGVAKTLTTLLLASLMFAFLLGYMPNAKVKIKAAFAGGIVTAILFGAWFKLCAMLQIGIGKYSALYGGFAVMPILLAWIYTSWQIVLFGAEIAFAVQNRDSFVFRDVSSRASFRGKALLALAICSALAKEAEKPDGRKLSAEEIAAQLGLPLHFVEQASERLVALDVLVKSESGDGYALCRDSSATSVASVLRALFDDGEDTLAAAMEEHGAALFGKKFDEALTKDFSNPVSRLV